ncbi:hypothetical protein CAG54_13320 [Vibrio sp. V27_P1S3P104]|uniref:hypothetical protein n=1 Tax=unclassified Vibrio TaxID=2614977 RepID=UPI001372CCF4|nr:MULTISPECIES: hypothetical protein [unclassified Vibrio]NAX34087.1 hypothetical protein [Vibrio sp. V29_P1S30P107]NAX38480.1 hypothetical protein [Vibrio sp. V27_P1S3P104]
MKVVVIENIPIISENLVRSFNVTSGDKIACSFRTTSDALKADLTRTKYLVSELYLSSTIYNTLVDLHKIKVLHPNISISVYTTSTDIPHLECILAFIGASHLIDKRMYSGNDVVDIVYGCPPMEFKCSKSDIEKAKAILSMGRNNTEILEMLAKHESVTSIALTNSKSKSAVSQALSKIENQFGSKRHLLSMFHPI